MTWKISIEINRKKSANIEDLLELAQRTASRVIETDPKIVIEYEADRLSDLDVMLDHLWNMKSATFFLGNHAFRPVYLRMVINCYIYKGMKTQNIASACWLCPAHGQCDREIGRKIDALFPQKKREEV